MKTWTPEETAVLLENYNKVSNDELCALIPSKSKMAIYKKARYIGLYKSKEIEFINRSIVRRGEKGANWRGGKSTTAKGYVAVKMPGHHRADKKGYVMEHIVVFERETGIKIPDGCCIHHLNGIKDDNRIENLCMMTHAAHTAMHNLKGRKNHE